MKSTIREQTVQKGEGGEGPSAFREHGAVPDAPRAAARSLRALIDEGGRQIAPAHGRAAHLREVAAELALERPAGGQEQPLEVREGGETPAVPERLARGPEQRVLKLLAEGGPWQAAHDRIR